MTAQSRYDVAPVTSASGAGVTARNGQKVLRQWHFLHPCNGVIGVTLPIGEYRENIGRYYVAPLPGESRVRLRSLSVTRFCRYSRYAHCQGNRVKKSVTKG
jgi:hypothetical protein